MLKKFFHSLKRFFFAFKKTAPAFFKKHLLPLLILINLVFVALILLFAEKIEKEKPLNPPSDILISEFPTVEIKKDLDLTALSAIVLEKQSRTVVYRKEENARFAPASATRL
jgi:hypothetical protein